MARPSTPRPPPRSTCVWRPNEFIGDGGDPAQVLVRVEMAELLSVDSVPLSCVLVRNSHLVRLPLFLVRLLPPLPLRPAPPLLGVPG